MICCNFKIQSLRLNIPIVLIGYSRLALKSLGGVFHVLEARGYMRG